MTEPILNPTQECKEKGCVNPVYRAGRCIGHYAANGYEEDQQ